MDQLEPPLADDSDESLIADYLAGESSSEDRAQIGAWLRADPRRQQTLDALRKLWERVPDALELPRRVNARQALRRVHDRRRQAARPPLRLTRTAGDQTALHHKRRAIFGSFIAVAAAAAFAILLVRPPGTWPSAQVADTSIRLFETSVGEVRRLALDDGSIVTLGPRSRLNTPSAFGNGEREVVLEAGEAFFEVKHDSAQPFRVLASAIELEVRGTAFGVRASNGDTSAVPTRVYVRSGRVAVRGSAAGSQDRILSTGAGLEISRDSVRLLTLTDVNRATSWMERTIEFDRAPMSEVSAEFARWYGLTLDVAPALSNRRLTATFTDEPPAVVISLIARLLGAEAIRHDATIYLAPR